MDEKSELAPSVLQALFDNGVCLCVFLVYYFVFAFYVSFVLFRLCSMPLCVYYFVFAFCYFFFVLFSLCSMPLCSPMVFVT